MLSLDTNILFAYVWTDHPDQPQAVGFMVPLHQRRDVVISEFVLLELYNLLRNASVLPKPLTTTKAVDCCLSFHRHPRWRVAGFPPDGARFHEEFWPRLRDPSFARRRAYDWRTALSLLHIGVTEFATANVKDFEGLGFTRVWNPLARLR